VANHKKTKTPRKPQHHLPKVGTPADNAYRQKRGRQDVVDFGVGHRRAGLSWLLAAIIVLVIIGAVVGLIALT
jgi:hypothetical protein